MSFNASFIKDADYCSASCSHSSTNSVRPLHVLYKIVHDNFDRIYGYGICKKILECGFIGLLTHEEANLLLDDFRLRKPNMFSRFYWNKSYIKSSAVWHYWWSCSIDDAGNAQRKKFLLHLVKKLK